MEKSIKNTIFIEITEKKKLQNFHFNLGTVYYNFLRIVDIFVIQITYFFK